MSINITSSKISSYLDEIPLTKQSRIDYTEELTRLNQTLQKCFKHFNGQASGSNIANFIKYSIQTEGKFIKLSLGNGSSINSLKNYLIHIGMDPRFAGNITRIVKNSKTPAYYKLIEQLNK